MRLDEDMNDLSSLLVAPSPHLGTTTSLGSKDILKPPRREWTTCDSTRLSEPCGHPVQSKKKQKQQKGKRQVWPSREKAPKQTKGGGSGLGMPGTHWPLLDWMSARLG
jgi:hypothetical protein